jgi:hypothetical protein
VAHHSNRLLGVALAVSAFLAPALSSARGQTDTGIEIAITGGQHAGTYKLPEANTVCLHVKSRRHFSAAYKDVAASDPKQVSEAGFNVFNPDDPGPKRGQINIRFGDPASKRPAPIEFSIPADSKGSLTLTRSGKSATLTFQGQTKDGTTLQVRAHCAAVDEF